MKDGWIQRLWEVIERDGRSPRALSLAAGLGPNYIQQTKSRGTHPVSEKLVSLLDELGPEATFYVYTGMSADADTLEFLERLSAMTPEQRKIAREFFQVLVKTEEKPVLRASEQVSSEPKQEP
ncbi:hypothetical protein JI664_14810 [Rhodobacter sp. NTK016B]|uniref:hypothetical protein n=1 Tax=Rhodobacter sp. NTK016B TaxID=2759676 RepID=UPI001A8FB59C|nr:hypothetical protein [Rhodobacter sp. NTK016B]MBN8293243.1 hypothetical protein [Rhodobacter sp. NTK016B]